MTKLVHFYDFADAAIEKIGDWFVRNYGFKPQRRDIVAFAITTIDELPAPIAEAKRTLLLTLPNKHTVKLSAEHWDKLSAYLKRNPTIALDTNILLTAAIIYRAANLPSDTTKNVWQKSTSVSTAPLRILPIQ